MQPAKIQITSPSASPSRAFQAGRIAIQNAAQHKEQCGYAVVPLVESLAYPPDGFNQRQYQPKKLADRDEEKYAQPPSDCPRPGGSFLWWGWHSWHSWDWNRVRLGWSNGLGSFPGSLTVINPFLVSLNYFPKFLDFLLVHR